MDELPFDQAKRLSVFLIGQERRQPVFFVLQFQNLIFKTVKRLCQAVKKNLLGVAIARRLFFLFFFAPLFLFFCRPAAVRGFLYVRFFGVLAIPAASKLLGC